VRASAAGDDTVAKLMAAIPALGKFCLMKATCGCVCDELSGAGAGSDREGYSRQQGCLIHTAPLLAFVE
jgi:hypothetical protein